MSEKNRMIPVILSHVLGFFVAQVILLLVLDGFYTLPAWWLNLYVLISLPLHVGLAGFLLVLRTSLYYLADKRPMKSLGIANRITIFRISTTPTIMILIMAFKTTPSLLPWIIALTALAFASDLVDGWVSRSFGEASKMGQYLDSSSDYMVLLMIGAVLAWYGLIDAWFFILTIIRYIIQWIMVGILFFRGNRGEEVKATFLGKASVFATMGVMGFAVLRLIPGFVFDQDAYLTFILVVEILCTVFLGVSLGEKIVVFIRGISRSLGPEDKNADEVPETHDF